MRNLILLLSLLLVAFQLAPTSGVVVKPGEDHTLPGGIELVNGSPESSKRAKIKATVYSYTYEDEDGQMIDKSGDMIDVSGPVRDSAVMNIEVGTIVNTHKDVEVVIAGTGGAVNIDGSKYDIKVVNEAKKGGGDITVTVGDHVATVGPGSTVTFTKGTLN